MYAYSGNEPINRLDPDGRIWQLPMCLYCHADKMRVLASLAVRHERSGLVADAEHTREKALESCRFAKLDRCSVEEMRVLGERAYRQ